MSSYLWPSVMATSTSSSTSVSGVQHSGEKRKQRFSSLAMSSSVASTTTSTSSASTSAPSTVSQFYEFLDSDTKDEDTKDDKRKDDYVLPPSPKKQCLEDFKGVKDKSAEVPKGVNDKSETKDKKQSEPTLVPTTVVVTLSPTTTHIPVSLAALVPASESSIDATREAHLQQLVDKLHELTDDKRIEIQQKQEARQDLLSVMPDDSATPNGAASYTPNNTNVSNTPNNTNAPKTPNTPTSPITPITPTASLTPNASVTP